MGVARPEAEVHGSREARSRKICTASLADVQSRVAQGAGNDWINMFRREVGDPPAIPKSKERKNKKRMRRWAVEDRQWKIDGVVTGDEGSTMDDEVWMD